MISMFYTVVALACIAFCIGIEADVNVAEKPQEEINKSEQLFRKLFKQRRAEQLDAVKGLVALSSYEKQYKMVNVILDKVFSVIQNSRVLLESSGYAAGISSFPRDETVLDALANILENTALFADIMLHLPDISQKVLAANYEWQVLFQWSISFANQTQLLDKQTVKLLHLANMELNATERDPDYENPYRKKEEKYQFQHEQKISSKKRKKVKKRGPRLSVGEL
ncbi:hypothetical protein R5R35_009629 [Gryllus longicercus]|uniref:Coiled-coil domain-containing protein n=1 Tax=Gryllus longicercus TaxID=2509291 RepID=A0AAN9YYT7_9ORTH